MPASDSVNQLVDPFGNNFVFYKTVQYNEYQLRQDFLDLFFKPLGWDMHDEAEFAGSK